LRLKYVTLTILVVLSVIGAILAIPASSLPNTLDETSPKSQISNDPVNSLIDEAMMLGCTEISINELKVISNLFDKDSDDEYYWVNEIAFEDYSLQQDLEKCKEIVYSLIDKK